MGLFSGEKEGKEVGAVTAKTGRKYNAIIPTLFLRFIAVVEERASFMMKSEEERRPTCHCPVDLFDRCRYAQLNNRLQTMVQSKIGGRKNRLWEKQFKRRCPTHSHSVSNVLIAEIFSPHLSLTSIRAVGTSSLVDLSHVF